MKLKNKKKTNRSMFQKWFFDQTTDFTHRIEKFEMMRDAIPALEYVDAINNVFKCFHITVADVKKWKIGKEYDVCLLSQIVSDHSSISNYNDSDTPINPEIFFKRHHYKVVYNGDFIFEVKHNWEDNWDTALCYTTYPSKTVTRGRRKKTCFSDGLMRDTKGWDWEYLREYHPDYNPNPTPDDIIVSIGWGPMILWDDLQYMPKVFHTNYNDMPPRSQKLIIPG